MLRPVQEALPASHLARPSQCTQVSSWAIPSSPGHRIRPLLFLGFHWVVGTSCARYHKPLCVCTIYILIPIWKHLEPELLGEWVSSCHQEPEAGRLTYLRVRPELWRNVRWESGRGRPSLSQLTWMGGDPRTGHIMVTSSPVLLTRVPVSPARCSMVGGTGVVGKKSDEGFRWRTAPSPELLPLPDIAVRYLESGPPPGEMRSTTWGPDSPTLLWPLSGHPAESWVGKLVSLT